MKKLRNGAALFLGALLLLPNSSALAKEKEPSPEAIAWVNCLREYGDRYISTDVSIETVATAAMGACKDHDDAVYKLRVTRPFGVRIFLGPPDRYDVRDAREEHEKLQADFRQRLIGELLEKRANLSKGDEQSALAPVAVNGAFGRGASRDAP